MGIFNKFNKYNALQDLAKTYIQLFKIIIAFLYLVGLYFFVIGLQTEQYWQLAILPLIILLTGNLALFILMYQHLESIDSKTPE